MNSMPKIRHIIGTYINGQRCRFLQELNDTDFNILLSEIGGTHPEGFWAWHLTEDENVDNSTKAKRIGELPYVTNPDGSPASPIKWVLEACENSKKDIPNRHMPSRQWRLQVYSGAWNKFPKVKEVLYFGDENKANEALTNVALNAFAEDDKFDGIEFPTWMRKNHWGIRIVDVAGEITDYVVMKMWE